MLFALTPVCPVLIWNVLNIPKMIQNNQKISFTPSRRIYLAKGHSKANRNVTKVELLRTIPSEKRSRSVVTGHYWYHGELLLVLGSTILHTFPDVQALGRLSFLVTENLEKRTGADELLVKALAEEQLFIRSRPIGRPSGWQREWSWI